MKKILKKPVTDSKFANLIRNLPPLDMYKGPWIAGGCARRLWMGQDWNETDVDVFFTDDMSRITWLQNLWQQWPNEPDNGLERITVGPSDDTWCLREITCSPARKKNSTYRSMELTINTDNADTYMLYNANDGSTKIQLIKVHHAHDICALWEDFDFTVSCFATDGKQVWAWENSVEDALANQIKINNPLRRDNLALRIIKHHSYGFHISDDLLLEAAELISKGEYQWPMNY